MSNKPTTAVGKAFMAGYDVGQADAFITVKNLIDDYKANLDAHKLYIPKEYAEGVNAVCDGFNDFVIGSLKLIKDRVEAHKGVLQDEIQEATAK